MNSLKYNLNIQILRGLSIIVVVLYHLGLQFEDYNFFQGGFIGVDIFFMISGYLITGILINNIDKKKLISNFLKKRFSRIYPLLVFSILTTLFLSHFIFTPEELVRLANSAISSLVFLSNIFFWKYLNSYNHDSAILNTLLHTWSLSIEMQFYFFFPFLFLIFKSNKKLLFKIIFIFGLLSFVIANISSYYEPNINFFGIQSRFFEFAFGSIFFLKFGNNLHKLKYINKNIIYFCIFFISIFFKSSYLHPSVFTLIFLVIVSFLIFDDSPKTNFIDKVLIFFGKISYSLYIWHFIVISFLVRLGSYSNIYLVFCGLVFSVGLSAVSLNFFEKRLRKDFKNSCYFVSICIFLIFFLISGILSNNGYPKRLSKVKVKIEEIYKQADTTNYTAIQNNFKNFDKKNIIILGNSHSVHTYNGFSYNKNLYKDFNISNFHIQIGCIRDALIKNKDYCKGLLDFNEKEKFKKGIQNLEYSNIVILSTRWTPHDLEELDKVILEFKNRKKNIIIFDNIYDIKKDANISLSNKYNFLEKYYLRNQFYYEQFLGIYKKIPNTIENLRLERKYFNGIDAKRRLRVSSKLLEIAKKNNLKVINLNEPICNINQKRCLYKTKDNLPIHHDQTGHLTKYGDRYVFKILSDKIKIIFNEYID